MNGEDPLICLNVVEVKFKLWKIWVPGYGVIYSENSVLKELINAADV